MSRYFELVDRIADRLTRRIVPRTSYVDAYRWTR